MGPDAGSLECGALKDFSGLIAAAWRKAAKTLHGRGWSSAGMDPAIVADPGVMPLIEATASVLDSAIEQAPMSEAMRDSLRRSNFIFSGLKTFHELNEAFPSLVDTSGNLKPFEQFLTDVQSIDKTYNRNYLRAEYNFAVASAQSAARWEEFEAGGDRYDLQYRTAGDGRVRPEHAALDRITLPVSSPFWDSFMPPNGWNCRCSVVQVRKGKYPNIDIARALELGEEATAKDKRGMLRFNSGKERSVWPKYNPYTIRRCRDCDIANGKNTLARLTPPDNNICASCQKLRTCQMLRSEIIKVGEGEIEISHLINRSDSDFECLMQVAKFFAAKGETVSLTPKKTRSSTFEYDCIYGSLKDTPYYGKCPDLKIGDHWYEHEGFTTANPKNAFRNMLNDGLKQSDYLIINKPDLTEGYMKRVIRQRIKDGHSISEIWLLEDGRLTMLYKKSEE